MVQNSFNGPVPKAGILSIAAYVPGKSGPKTGKIFKLSSNESPMGPSPKSVAAFESTTRLSLALYPEGGAGQLRQAIAQRFKLIEQNIVCGSGSDELLQLLAHAYLGPGDEAIYSQFGFLVYPIAIATNGAKAIVAPEKDYVADVGEILSRVTASTKMVFLANPNNPTGTYLPFTEIKRLHSGLPSHVMLVLDAAYAEKAARISLLFRDLSQIIAQEKDALAKTLSAAPDFAQPQKLAFHSPCSLQHGLQIKNIVEGLLRDAGYELTMVPDGHLCCGSAGTYSLLQSELSQQLLANKVKALESGSPAVIATANIGCLAHIESGLNSSTQTPIRHWIELLDDRLAS